MTSIQLAEAILTEPATHTVDDAGSIRLADTRTRPRTSGENERDIFLPRGDESDGSEDEEARREERRRVLSNSGAHLSRINLRSPSEGSEDEDGYEIVNGDVSAGVSENEERNNPGTLSAKAGIILVRDH